MHNEATYRPGETIQVGCNNWYVRGTAGGVGGYPGCPGTEVLIRNALSLSMASGGHTQHRLSRRLGSALVSPEGSPQSLWEGSHSLGALS